MRVRSRKSRHASAWRWPAALVAALTVTATAVIHADDTYDIRVYPCPHAYETITIDGILDEDVWQRATATTDFTWYNRPEPAEVQTLVRWAYDTTHLYVAVTCIEPNMERHTPVSQPRDAHAVFHGETIEIFIDPDHDHSSYYQIAVNSAGSVYDSRHTDPTWSTDVRAAVQAAADHWTLEVAIPWADMGPAPEAGAVVGANVCRDRYLGPDKQWTNWSQTKGGFHDPARFGHLVLSPSAQAIARLEEELRRGGRRGPIRIDGTERFVQAAYRALTVAAFETTKAWLGELEATGQTESRQETQLALSQRVTAYHTELRDLKQAVGERGAIDPSVWLQVTARLGEIRQEIDRVIWEARLEGLISGI